MPLTDREKPLLARAREHLAMGLLPRTIPKSIGAGSGTGAVCSLCEQTIEPKQVEYEFTFPEGGTAYRFHMRCHAIWQLAADDTSQPADSQP